MNFVFESVRRRGGRGSTVSEPDYPAVRITAYTETKKAGSPKRLRFAFTRKTVSYARWIQGDRLECGADPDNMLIAFKRGAAGYKLLGKGFSDRSKDRPSIQVTVNSDSPVALIADMCLNRWIRLSESGVLLVTEKIDKQE